jgi:sugar phosphate isomerase/epimerase
MYRPSRRMFIRQSALAVGALLPGPFIFGSKKKAPLLSFSTLGCPDWAFEQIIQFAVTHGYAGLELRGIQRELDLTKCREFNSAQSRASSLRMMEENQLHFVGLGSSATLHFPEGNERQKNLDEGRRFIDLANDLKCPYVRVFPNNFPKDQEKEATFELVSKGLLTLAAHAKGSGVSVLLETHGDFVRIADIEKVMQSAAHPKVGIIWDITNMWTITKESPAAAYQQLNKYIRHTHIKDAVVREGKIQYTLLGKGEVPIFEAIDILLQGGYGGYYSFEWEKLWHPELAEPGIALADYPQAIKLHVK